MPKRASVVVTNPKASRLPRSAGNVVMTLATPEPIRPKLPPKYMQMKPGPHVVFTSPKASAASLPGRS
jgi:hypothetical protein